MLQQQVIVPKVSKQSNQYCLQMWWEAPNHEDPFHAGGTREAFGEKVTKVNRLSQKAEEGRSKS